MAGPFMKRENIMLAYPAESKRIKAFPVTDAASQTRSFFEQPKLNGERGRTEWFREQPFVISSMGNTFQFIDHVQADLYTLGRLFKFPKFDGEMYVHGWSRERIDSALRRRKNNTNPDTVLLQYHIFDVQNTSQLQWERIRQLGEFDQAIHEHKLGSLQVVPYSLTTEFNWLVACQDHIENGYEGIMLRNPFGKYVMKRSSDLLKFKPTHKDTYVIVGINEAISQEGENKGMVGSFEVRSPNEPGKSTFNVGAGKLSHDLRIKYFNNKEMVLGKFLLVKHEMLRTSGDVPIAAVAVEVLGI